MDFHNQKLLKGKNNSSIGEAEDRISGLPDEILHHILSFLDIKLVVRTCVLSKRWNVIWTSMPILEFPYCYTDSVSKANNFMDFLDKLLLLRDASSNIQKIRFDTNINFDAFRVRSWIYNITKRHNVKELDLQLGNPFSIPSSLFKCESLTKLELSASCSIPKCFSFPKLKILRLNYIRFTEDDGWNVQPFSNCPVLESLILEDCTWLGMRKFCILTPVLKVLKFDNCYSRKDDDLKIYAPNLVSLNYSAGVAKDYDLSSFVKLDNAEIYFDKDNDAEKIIGHGAAVSKFFLALSHVRSLEISTNGLEEVLWSCDYGRVFDETQDMFRHLQSVRFLRFGGNARQVRWAKFILKNAKSLQTMNIEHGTYHSKNKDVVMLELSSLARASGRCVIN